MMTVMKVANTYSRVCPYVTKGLHIRPFTYSYDSFRARYYSFILKMEASRDEGI